jgi:hypothetical protein
VEKAVDDKIDFLNTLNTKFQDIRENGRTIVLTIGVGNDQAFDMDTEINAEMCSLMLSRISWQIMPLKAKYIGNQHE